MIRINVEEATKKSVADLIELVRNKFEEMVVSGPDGDLVRVVPVPKPVYFYKGKPVYRLEDAQYLDFEW